MHYLLFFHLSREATKTVERGRLSKIIDAHASKYLSKAQTALIKS